MKPFALLDEQENSRLFTGLVAVHEHAEAAALPRLTNPAVLLADYEGPFRLYEFERCTTPSQAEIDSLLDGAARVSEPRPDVTQAGFRAGVQRIQEHIKAGDTYQVNYTFRLRFDVDGSPGGLYRTLRRAQPVAYGALMALPDDRWVLSRSPELFVEHRGGHLRTRPMKGTAPRGATTADDHRQAEWLRTDPKIRAENLMIVDLLRNDVGRVAETGTVHTPALFEAERYPTVWQLTSTVAARLRPGLTLGDVLTALFPCGSITGAPKLRTMQLIAEIETSRRGLYTGSIGWVDPGGDFCLSVAIRTATLSPHTQPADPASGVARQRYRGTLGVGAGIVLDSQADAEWEECLLKARFLSDLAD